MLDKFEYIYQIWLPTMLETENFKISESGCYDVLGAEDKFQSMMSSRIAQLQGNRSRGSPKIGANPESIIQAVKQGKISLEELKKQIASLD